MINQTLIQRRPVREVDNTSSLTFLELDKYKRIYSTHTSGINYILTENRFQKNDVIQLFSVGGGTLSGTNITFVGGTSIPANSSVELVCVAANVFTVQISGVGSSDVNWIDIIGKPVTFPPDKPIVTATPIDANVLLNLTTGRIKRQENTTNNALNYVLGAQILPGAWELWTINAPSEPNVFYSDGTTPVDKIPCPDFIPNTDMYMYIFSVATGFAQYYFLEL